VETRFSEETKVKQRSERERKAQLRYSMVSNVDRVKENRKMSRNANVEMQTPGSGAVDAVMNL